MTEAERSFYEWFHTEGKSGYVLDTIREAYLAGWGGCEIAWAAQHCEEAPHA